MKVYISSTYKDLHRHRVAVATALRRMGHQPIGMEDYVAEGVKPVHRCLEDVDKCDAYLGIFAWRYGFVPAGPQPTAPTAGLPVGAPPPAPGAPARPFPPGTGFNCTSITEFEFRQAMEAKKPILAFLLDAEAEWPSSQIDAISGDGESGCAIGRLRQEIAQNHVVGYFRTPEDLASLVSAAIYREELKRQIRLESLDVEVLSDPGFASGALPVVNSSLNQIQKLVAGPKDVLALQIDLGRGQNWWASRLYFLASLAADLTTIEIIVFQDQESFVGIADPRTVKDRLWPIHPAIANYESALTKSGVRNADLFGEVNRRAGIWMNQMDHPAGSAESANPIFVTERELKRWLKPHLITRAIDSEPSDNAPFLMQRLMDWPMRFVPIVEKGKLARVVDKRALAEKIASIFVREQVSRALSMTR